MQTDRTLIAEQFNKTNRADLWKLRDWFGYKALDHTFCDQFGRITHITAEHADRLMEQGKNVYVDVPIDTECPIERYRE